MYAVMQVYHPTTQDKEGWTGYGKDRSKSKEKGEGPKLAGIYVTPSHVHVKRIEEKGYQVIPFTYPRLAFRRQSRDLPP